MGGDKFVEDNGLCSEDCFTRAFVWRIIRLYIILNVVVKIFFEPILIDYFKYRLCINVFSFLCYEESIDETGRYIGSNDGVENYFREHL